MGKSFDFFCVWVFSVSITNKFDSGYVRKSYNLNLGLFYLTQTDIIHLIFLCIDFVDRKKKIVGDKL